MTDVLKYEARRHITGAIALAVLLGLLVVFTLSIYPSIEASGEAIVDFIEQLPEQMQTSFAVDAYTTIEGFLATEFYQFMWLLLVGLYLIYIGGGTIASDVETGRIDLLLATPISRRRLVYEKYLALLVPILVVNLLIPLFVYAGLIVIEESIPVADLVLLHAVSIPYLALTAALGVALSVFVKRADFAKRGGLALLFVLFIVDSVTMDTDYEWVGAVSPTRYFDPADVLVDQSPDLLGVTILTVATIALVLASAEVFRKTDV